MYVPPAFRCDDLPILQATIRQARLASLVTATAQGLVATPLPLFLAADEGAFGTLYGHLARANPQWTLPPAGDAMVLFAGPDAYVSPSFYPSKQQQGKVVPTWNYVAIHAYGPVSFFKEPDRLAEIVERLTDHHERQRPEPWAVGDAPKPFIQAQLKGIVGVRLPIARLEGKRKLSQNRTAEDRAGVARGLAASPLQAERDTAALIAREDGV